MGSNNTIELTAKGSKKEVTEILKSINGIKSCTVDNASGGCVECFISCNSDAEIRDDLNKKLASKNISIYRLVNDSKSLEDIFLELTDDAYVEKIDDIGSGIFFFGLIGKNNSYDYEKNNRNTEIENQIANGFLVVQSVVTPCLRIDFGFKYANVGEIPVFFVIVKTISDNKEIVDGKACIIGGNRFFTSFGLVKEDAQFYAFGTFGENIVFQQIKRMACIKDIFDDKDIFAGDIFGEVFFYVDFSGGHGRASIA